MLGQQLRNLEDLERVYDLFIVGEGLGRVITWTTGASPRSSFPYPESITGGQYRYE